MSIEVKKKENYWIPSFANILLIPSPIPSAAPVIRATLLSSLVFCQKIKNKRVSCHVKRKTKKSVGYLPARASAVEKCENIL